jgi:pSer/pThr/pTyr-binding forkhead associated (FHA) protein
LPGGGETAKVRLAMARLIFEKADGERQEVPVEDEPISLGRGAEADVDVGDVEVSRHHCSLLLWDDDWVLKDARSRNGTWVNERRVEVAVLKDGDIVRIGKTDLDFHAEKPQRGRERYAVLKELTIPEAAEAEAEDQDDAEDTARA